VEESELEAGRVRSRDVKKKKKRKKKGKKKKKEIRITGGQDQEKEEGQRGQSPSGCLEQKQGGQWIGIGL